MTKLIVNELAIYPIKSAKGLNCQSIQLNTMGPECDRRWMVVDDKGSFVTQRTFSKMCLIETQLAGGELLISSPGYEQIMVPAGSGERITSSVWGSTVFGEDCGEYAANWISRFIDKPCRFIYMQDEYERLVDPEFASNNQRVGFADGFPLLVTTQASLDDFNSKLGQINTGLAIRMNRFRPNIVISGNLAWEEDQWRKISIAGIELSLVKPCSRCIMPSIDPANGEKQMAVNQTLLKFRRRDRKTYFGQNAIYNRVGRISLGDSVEILD